MVNINVSLYVSKLGNVLDLINRRVMRLLFTLGESMNLTSTLLIALGFLALANVAQAAVITTAEWESKPGAPWTYAKTDIDCTVPKSPAGGCALRITYPAGTYSTSFSAGRAEYGLGGDPTEIYVGAWMRYSNPFTFHPIGHKVNIFYLAGSNPGCRNTGAGYANDRLAGAAQICWGKGTTNYFQNVGSWNHHAHLNEWHWYEMRIKVNTPGGSDGIIQIWIDNTLYVNYSTVQLRNVGDTAGIRYMQHTGEWGGGGGTITQTGFWWIDHTVISTTRIGMPGGAGTSTDSVAPAAPVGITVR
jgi:hypothetical protein